MSLVTQVQNGPSIKTIRIACAVVVFVLSLALYAWTLAPTVTLIDSGELIVAARSLGVAHPPGFPLYVILAHIATLIPIGSVAVRVNFASAFFAASAATICALLLVEAMTTVVAVPVIKSEKSGPRGKKTKRSNPITTWRIPSRVSPITIVVSCLVSGLLLAFSRTLWSYATLAEVYTLNCFLILSIFLLMFHWRRKSLESLVVKKENTGQQESGTKPLSTGTAVSARSGIPTEQQKIDRWLYAAALLFGIALGVHHVTVGLMLPALAVLVFATADFRFFASKRLLIAAAISICGLFAVYLYLPLAASKSPIMNWGDPRTLQRLIWHVTGKQYQVFFDALSMDTASSQFAGFLKLMSREFGPSWLPVGILMSLAGFISLWRRDRALLWFLGLVILADVAYSMAYEIAEDKDAYYLPAFVAMIIAAGFGCEWLINKLTTLYAASNLEKPVAILLVILIPGTALAGNWSYDNRGHYFIARDYIGNILSTMQPGGMLLTRDWQVYSPLLYLQAIETVRPDVVAIDINQLRRSWYFDYLRRVYPETMKAAEDQVDAFLEDLRHWEQDPDLYQRDLTLNQRINTRFFDMISAFVGNHITSAPVYVTLDVAANRDGADAELTKRLASAYQFIPQGLVFQMSQERAFQNPPAANLVTRGLVDGTLKFDEDDVVTKKVIPVYANMLYNRGRYLAVSGRHEEAIEAFKQSLLFNPTFSLAQQAINESTNAIRKGAK
jgi:tetratricopeptide (TPR) repeat protein